MAQLKIVLGGGNPTHTLDIGTDEEALATMRDYLAGDPASYFESGAILDVDEAPQATDWLTASDSLVVKVFAERLFETTNALRNRGRRRLAAIL